MLLLFIEDHDPRVMDQGVAFVPDDYDRAKMIAEARDLFPNPNILCEMPVTDEHYQRIRNSIDEYALYMR